MTGRVKQKKLNIKEMARKAGVSVATISRAINSETRGKVAPDTLQEVDKLIRKYGYTPNLAAKNLRQTSTKTIGVIFPYLPGIFYSNYYNQILAGIADHLIETDYKFKLLLLSGDKKKWNQYDFRMGERVDALVLTHWFKYFSGRQVIEDLNVPHLIVNDIDKSVRSYFVGVDHYVGGRIAAHHLYSLGHRRICVLTGPDWSVDNRQRMEGFLKYFEEKGVKIASDSIVCGEFLEDRAYGAVVEFFYQNPRPTAIFCCNDQMAYGAIRKMRELGIHCPQDISILGYDDESRAVDFNPPLTTIHVPVYDFAREGARLLTQYLQQDNPPKAFIGQTLRPVQLVERSSLRKV